MFLDFSLKGKKNVYTANCNLETQYPDGENPVRNFSFGGTASFSRTQYGEFNSGLNGELRANISQQGYKFEVDGGYNYYGAEHSSSTDYLVCSVTTLEKNELENSLATGIYGALRFNNCNTIIEPKTCFARSKRNNNGEVIKSYKAGVGIYQQIGRQFDDASVFLHGERVIFSGGEQQNYTEINAGINKKATQKLRLNADATWKSNAQSSISMGLVYNF